MAGILRTDTIQNANASTLITQANSTTITIGTSGQTIALASGATSSGFGATYNGAINWDTTAKTTGFTAVSGTGYFCNTNSAAFTATLPATPTAGDIVAFSDYTGTWVTNNLTIGRNSSNINGMAANFTCNINNSTAFFIYVDATEGWRLVNTGAFSNVNNALFVAATGGTVTTCGDYKIHTFTGPGTFTVTCAGNASGSNKVDYLVVAGGASGACNHAGGGGAGGYRESVPSPAAWTASPLANPGGALPVSATGYPITVGAGGASSRNPGNSSIFSSITSAGGGTGANDCNAAANGGSGGGGHRCRVTAGTGNSPPTSPPQGNPGGNAGGPSAGQISGGGGGGATAAGTASGPSGTPGGAGGAGATSSINGTPTGRAGGGGGGAYSGTGGTASQGGGAGGAGAGTGTAGTANTGGGGGGGSTASAAGGAGGSGIVIIRYKFQ